MLNLQTNEAKTFVNDLSRRQSQRDGPLVLLAKSIPHSFGRPLAGRSYLPAKVAEAAFSTRHTARASRRAYRDNFSHAASVFWPAKGLHGKRNRDIIK